MKPIPTTMVSSSAGLELYVERKADAQAWAKIEKMDYVLLVEPPQQGKTSLIHRLGACCANNYAFAYLDLVNLDRSTEEGWYGSLGQEILRQLTPAIATRTQQFPARRAPGSPSCGNSLRWRTVVRKRLVIALDEVGAIPEDWATDFFAMIRSVYMHRGGRECFRYLTFVISGARNPRDMIRDPSIPDFNFERTLIDDLSLSQVVGLLEPLNIGPRLSEVAIRLYYWTEGQPYLCQRTPRVLGRGGSHSRCEIC